MRKIMGRSSRTWVLRAFMGIGAEREVRDYLNKVTHGGLGDSYVHVNQDAERFRTLLVHSLRLRQATERLNDNLWTYKHLRSQQQFERMFTSCIASM